MIGTARNCVAPLHVIIVLSSVARVHAEFFLFKVDHAYKSCEILNNLEDFVEFNVNSYLVRIIIGICTLLTQQTKWQTKSQIGSCISRDNCDKHTLRKICFQTSAFFSVIYKIQKHFQNVMLIGMASEISKNYTYKCVDRSRHNGIKGTKAKCAH